MANFREDFFAQLDAGARWSVPVAINRNNPLPLDDNSVFRSQADLDTYLAGPLVYPGQIVALVKADETIIYYIDQNKVLKEIGANLSTDGKTIAIDDNGVVSLFNLPEDTTKTYNAVLVNGQLEWHEPSATTVEGLDTRLTAAEGKITNLESAVAELGKAFEFKGTANNISNDNKTIYDTNGDAIEAAIGDVYQIGDKEYAYNGTEWVELGFNVDLSGYATDAELKAVDTKAENAGTAAQNAQNTADEAKTAASNAATAAQNAQDTADAAATAATAADTKAQQGVDNAATAQAAAEAAQSTANTAKNNAATNATAITSLQELVNGHGATLTTLTEAKNDHASRISVLETAKTEQNAKLVALEGSVDTNTGNIANLTTELSSAKGTIASHTTSISEINTKNAEQDNAIAAIKATAEAAATQTALTEEINRAKAAEEANAATIKVINDDYLKEADKEELAGLIDGNTKAIAAEAERAAAAEKANADAIALLTEQVGNVTNIMNFRGVIDTDAEDYNPDEPFAQIEDPQAGDVAILGDQQWVYNGATWAVYGDATGNAAAITALSGRVITVENAVNTTLPGAIAQALADAKAYTDQEIGKIVLPSAAEQTVLGLIKGTENKVNVAAGEITGISTDLLFQGVNELILNGGNANATASN